MKRSISLVLLLMVIVSMFSPALAEDTAVMESQFDKVILQKGTLIIKEYSDYESITTTNANRDINIQTAVVTDVETGLKYYALRLEHSYYNSKYDNGTSIGVLDIAEVDDVIATLEYIKNHITEFKDYTEVVYNASDGMTIGMYCSDIRIRVFVRFSAYDTTYIEVDNIDKVIDTFRGAQNSLLNN